MSFVANLNVENMNFVEIAMQNLNRQQKNALGGLAMNRMEKVAEMFGLKLNEPFRTKSFPGKYRFTDYGIETWDGEVWFQQLSQMP